MRPAAPDLTLMLRRWLQTFTRCGAGRALLAAAFLCLVGAETAYAQLTVTPVTWNVIGLDSNNVNIGPNTFQSGARACNTGAATLNNLVATFVWDSTNPFINLSGSNPVRARTLAAGACVDFYFTITVTRTSAAYDTARRYHITVAADGVAGVSTPTPREFYVERIISQGRNTVAGITGPSTVYIGQIAQYTLTASTATQGYEQLEAFIDLPNIVFQVLSIQTTYSSPAGGTNNKFYADACGWENDPLSANYRSCVGPSQYSGGKAGGSIVSVYTVKILSSGATTAGALILDFSGSSYHYNNDYGASTLTVTATDPPLTLSKTAAPSPVTAAAADVTYTLRVTNTGASAVTLTDFVDTPPTSPAAATYVSGSSTFNGAAVANPTASGPTLVWSGSFAIPANSTRDLVYRMTIPNRAGTYTNTAVARLDYTQVDTTAATGDNSPATASVVRSPPSVALVKSVSPTGTVLAGSDLAYSIAFTNAGGAPASGFSITDPVPANTDFKVGSAATTLGTTSLTVSIVYSNDNGATWTHTPASGGGGAPAGYDRSVTHVRWTFSGSLIQTAPNNAGAVSFAVRIR
jgi:uncharacterized repeat protein (TIGR01451 family)